jgi:hypothetical protein
VSRHGLSKGKKGIRERVRSHLSSAIGLAHPWHDGFQTPMQKTKGKESETHSDNGEFVSGQHYVLGLPW